MRFLISVPIEFLNTAHLFQDHNLTWTFFFLGILTAISPCLRVGVGEDLNIEYGTG